MDYGKKGFMRVAGWYIVDVKFPDLANKLDEVIIDTIINCGEALPHATSPEETAAVLDILLSNAQELYRRAQERTAH
jgi:hypothetical protein|nr:MAG TPA: hypothetical protein [Caudoviricetes sp.]